MSYDVLSRHYDRLMGDFPYEKYLAFICPKAGEKCLDLACGTGKVSRMLAAQGARVHGVDLSEDMLNIAVREARAQGLAVTFGQGDMRKFEGTGYDLVTCVSDGLNYIPTKDLPPLFERVEAALAEGGRMVFDVSTPYKLREVLGDNVYYEDYDDLTYYWENAYSERTKSVRMKLTFFEKVGDAYRREEETQKQYAHEAEDIRAALDQAGLTIARRVDGDAFDKVRAKSLRWVYDVRKKR